MTKKSFKGIVKNGIITFDENIEIPNGSEVLVTITGKLNTKINSLNLESTEKQNNPELIKNSGKDLITIYSDGSCLGNPGIGGYAAILIYKKKEKQISGGFQNTTNNRMELMAVIKALQEINSKNRYDIKVYSDSRYIIDSIKKKWLNGWKASNWVKKGKKIGRASCRERV